MCSGEKLTDDQILVQLSDLSKHEFVKWNTTTLEYIIGYATGYRGLEIRTLSLQIYDSFIEWYRGYRGLITPICDFASTVGGFIYIRKLLMDIDQTQFGTDVERNLKIAIDFMNLIDP